MSNLLYPRRPLKTLALTVLLSIWCANAQPLSAQNNQPDDKQESIRGVVVNSVTHEPVGRALVHSPDDRFAMFTDSEGRFEFTFPQADSEKSPADESGSPDRFRQRGQNLQLMLMAKKPGFLEDHMGIRNRQSDSAGKEITIPLTPEALIVGRVVLVTSEPSDPIQLELYRRQVQEGRAHWVLSGSAWTKSNGEFRFAELAAGNYKLLTRELLDRDPLTFDPRGQLYGYPPIYFPNATNFEAAQTIQLAAGQTLQADISLVRHAYYPVKVTIANVPEIVHGVNIVVSPQGQRSPGFALGYNNRSQTIEGLLPDGNYTLQASSFAPNPASGLLNITVRSAPVEGPEMILVSNGSIKVNVKEEFTSGEEGASRNFNVEGNPAAFIPQGPRRYLNVRLEPADDFGQRGPGWLRPPSGPEDDSLVIEGTPPGRYWVKVDTSRGFASAISSGTTDLQHHPLIVGPGGSSAPIEITMRDDTAEIDGTVESLAASPTGSSSQVSEGSSAHLYCIPLPDSSGEFKDIWVQADGKFGPQQMPPGTYRVLAFDRPQPDLEYRNPEAMKAYDAKGQLVRLIAGQKEHLHLQLVSPAE
ncbi:MAG: hypothetical protein ABSC15_19825 [Terriglobales bacterium]